MHCWAQAHPGGTMNHQSGCWEPPWHLFLWLHLLSLSLHSIASRGRGERTGLIYGRLCTGSQCQLEWTASVYSLFRGVPERWWWRKEKSSPWPECQAAHVLPTWCGRKGGLWCRLIGTHEQYLMGWRFAETGKNIAGSLLP